MSWVPGAVSWVTPRRHWVTKGTWVWGQPGPQPGKSRRGGKTWVLGAEIWVLMVGNRGWVCWVLGLGS